MIRTKLGLLGLCAVVVGVTAMSAGSAQATFSWLILNSTHSTATELKALLVGEKDSADLTLLTKIIKLNVAITCTNFALNGVNLEAGGKLTTGGKVVLTGCQAYGKGTLEEALGCRVHSAGAAEGTIESNKSKGELVLHFVGFDEVLKVKIELRELLIKIEPETAGGSLITILAENCILPESNPVKGVLYLEDLFAPQVHDVKHLVGQGPLTSLFVGADTAEHLETSIDGSAWIKLGGEHAGLEWAGMDA